MCIDENWHDFHFNHETFQCEDASTTDRKVEVEKMAKEKVDLEKNHLQLGEVGCFGNSNEIPYGNAESPRATCK